MEKATNIDDYMKHYIPRYWSPLGSTIPVDEHGFLIDDFTMIGKYQRDSLRRITAIPERVSVLLGGSGEGKSTDFEYLIEHADESYVHRIDLLRLTKEAIDNGNLRRSVEEDDGFASAREQNQPVILVIDSFDECSYMDRKLVFTFASQLKSLIRPNDSVRIASRPDDLTNVLLDWLRKEFGTEVVNVYNIAPLSRGDVIALAESNGLDSDSFLQYIVDYDLSEFATNPLLLTFLAEAYYNEPSVSQVRARLYEQHLLTLLDKSNRATSSKTPVHTSGEIMSVAERCALATVFSGRNFISKLSGVQDQAGDFVSFDELMHSPRRDDAEAHSLSKATLEELLSTPLFRVQLDGRAEWHHRSYAEFLAARSLSKSKLKPAQVVSLFTTTVLAEPGVPSQLFQCASFLVELRPDLIEDFLELEPEIFFVADISHIGDSQKARIVERVLKQFVSGRAYDRIDLRSRYRRLAHPSLALQLRPIVTSTTFNSVARRLAIDVAQECRVIELLPQLLKVALNEDEQLHDRVQVIHAIVHIGEADYIRELRPLLSVPEDDDPDCELRGSALLGLWPSFVDVDELASTLTAIRVPDLLGSYFRFVRYHLPHTLSDDDLPQLLKVLTVLLRQVYTMRYYDELVLVVVSRSLNLVGTCDELCSLLASFFLESAHGGTSLLRLSAIGSTETLRQEVIRRIHGESVLRRAIVSKMSEQVGDAQYQVSVLRSECECIVSTNDLDWFIEQLAADLSQMQRLFYCSLVEAVVDWNDAAIADKVLTAAYRHNELYEMLRHQILPVDLDSERAAQMRKRAGNDKSRRVEQPKDNEQKYLTHLRDTVQSPTIDDSDKWLRICQSMSVNVDTGMYYRSWDPNITRSQLWPLLDESEQSHVCDIAMAFLAKHQPSDAPTPGSLITGESLAAYRALVLLYLLREPEVSHCRSDFYRKWISRIIYYPTGLVTDDDEMHARLVSLAYQGCRMEVLDTFKTLLRYEISRIREKGTDKLRDPTEALLFCQRKLTLCWDVDVERVLMDAVRDNRDLPEILPSLLSFMGEHNSESARKYVHDVLESGDPIGVVQRREWIACAVEAMTFAKEEEWDLIWCTLLQHTELCKEAFLDYVYRERYSKRNLLARLTESQQANLFIWLERHYPHDSDPKHKGAHMVSSRDMICDFRDGILRSLIGRGTGDAVRELERIQREYPEHPWLKYTLVDARRRAHETTWSPIDPAVLLEYLSGGDSRLVRSESDLRDVLIESLSRLSENLQGNVPIAELFWNTPGDRRFTPKDETVLSNYIKHHLESELLEPSRIVVNREVVIDAGGHRGKKTDIHVDCFTATDNGARIKAVIEVKCCWNKDLMSAMESQLAEQYMNDTECRVGIYLVGYYDCVLWDDDHRKKKACSHGSRAELYSQLYEQGEKLSNEHRIIVPYVLDMTLRQ